MERITLSVENVFIEPMGGKYIDVSFINVDTDDLLAKVGIDKAVEFYGITELKQYIAENEKSECCDASITESGFCSECKEHAR